MIAQFNVYYDSITSSLSAVSPVAMDSLKHLPVIKVPRAVGIKFLTGEHRLDQWYVAVNKNKTSLTQNILDIQCFDTGAYLSIPRKSDGSAVTMGVDATIFLHNNTIEFSIPEEFINRKLKNVKQLHMVFFLTKRNDPTFLIDEFKISISKLIATGLQTVKFKSNLRDFSLFTNKVFNNYSLDIRKSARRLVSNSLDFRINQLVPFKIRSEIPEKFTGILAIQDTTNNALILKCTDDCEISTIENSSVLFITKKYDPTIFSQIINFDMQELIDNGEIVLPLPDNIGNDFGIAGFPYVDNMIMIKTK